RKGAKSRRRITGLRSKTTKARTHVDCVRAANADLKKETRRGAGAAAGDGRDTGRHFQLAGGCAARNLQTLLSRLSKICLSRRESAVSAPKFSCASMMRRF